MSFEQNVSLPVTNPILEVVSDDIVLPDAESSAISRTREQYAAMEPEQKRDFWLAVASTAGGVALTAAAFAVEKRSPQSRLPIVFRSAGYTLDFVDGYFAKRSATHQSTGAGTEFGAILDPLADKLNNTLNEIALIRDKRLQPSDFAVRALRDVGITATRRFITKRANGNIDVRANKFGKLNTVIRDGVNLFASTNTASKYPRANRALQTSANIYSVASGVYTASQLIQAYRGKS